VRPLHLCNFLEVGTHTPKTIICHCDFSRSVGSLNRHVNEPRKDTPLAQRPDAGGLAISPLGNSFNTISASSVGWVSCLNPTVVSLLITGTTHNDNREIGIETKNIQFMNSEFGSEQTVRSKHFSVSRS